MNPNSKDTMKKVWGYWDLFFYLIILAITLSNFFEEGMLINAVDANFPFTLNAIDKRIEDFSSLINNAGTGEKFNPFPFYTVFPYLFYLKFLGLLTGDIHSAQELLFFTYFTVCYISTRLFVQEYFNIRSPLAFFISGLSYAMNPFSDFLFTAYLPGIWLAYAFFPLVAYFLIVAAKRHSRTHYLLFLLSYEVFIISYVPNPPSFLVLTFLGISLLLCCPQVNWLRKTKIIGLTTALLLVINSFDIYLLLQYFGSTFSDRGELFSSEKPSLSALKISSSSSTVLNVMRLMNLTGFHSIYWKDGIAQYSRVFYSLKAFPIILSFVPIVLIVAGLFINRGRNKIFLNTFILCLVFMFLAKSIKPPFGSLFYLLFDNITILQMFRSAPEKFGLAVAFLVCILLGKSVEILSSQLDRSRIYIFSFCLLIVFLFFRLPWFNGDIITDEKGEMPSFYTKLPSYYLDFEKDMQKEEHKTFLNLPSYGRPYMWGLFHWGYFGVNLLHHFSDNKTILSPVLSGSAQSQWLRDVVSYNLGETVHVPLAKQEKVENILPYLSLLGIKEIVVDMDRIKDHEHYTTSDPKVIQERVESLLGEYIKEKKSYGENKILRYILDDTAIADEMYLASRKSTFPNLKSLKKWKDYGLSEGSPTKIAVLKDSDLILKNVNLGDGDLGFSRIGPTKYLVNISNAESSVLLVFSKEFNKWWKFKPNKEMTAKHVSVNDYANGWIISPKEGHQGFKDLKLTLEFDLQKYADFRNIFKGSLLLLSLIWIALEFARKQKILPQKTSK